MQRRQFLGFVSGAVAWPVTARAQQTGKLPRIGFFGAATPAAWGHWVAAFVKRLNELGWVEGRTVVIEYRWAEGNLQRFTEIAAELIQLKVDVIYAVGTQAALAAKKATATIPIVFPVAGDPIGTGLVASLARPGGNVTGLSDLAVELAAKRLDLLREALPNVKRLGILANPTYSGMPLELRGIDEAARRLGFDIILRAIQRAEDIGPTIEALKGTVEALYVVSEPFVSANRAEINAFALAARMPTIYAQRDYIEAGGLMSYGPNYPDLNRRAANYVDKILRGTNPGDLPVEQPTKFDLTINLITAKALGLEVPLFLQQRADEVIE